MIPIRLPATQMTRTLEISSLFEQTLQFTTSFRRLIEFPYILLRSDRLRWARIVSLGNLWGLTIGSFQAPNSELKITIVRQVNKFIYLSNEIVYFPFPSFSNRHFIQG